MVTKSRVLPGRMIHDISGFAGDDHTRFQETRTLLHSFENMKTRAGHKDMRVSDLYLVSTKHGVEFVQKHSLRGWWTWFKAAVRRFLGQETSIDAERVIKIAYDILRIPLRGVSFGQKKRFLRDMVLAETGSSPLTQEKLEDKVKDMRKRLESLRQKVDDLRDAIIASPPHTRTQRKEVITEDGKKARVVDILKKLKIAPFSAQAAVRPKAKKGEKTARRVTDLTHAFFKNKEEDRQRVRSALRELECFRRIDTGVGSNVREIDAMLDVVVPLICSYEGREEVMSELQKEVPQLEPFRMALMKGLFSVQEKEADTLLKVIQNLTPPVPHGAVMPLCVHEMALIFGDSFIKESGYEGEISSMPFVGLMRAFFESKGIPEPGSIQERMQRELASAVDLRVDGGNPHETMAQVLRTIEQHGRCLISGGWLKHAIMYEVVKQENGMYRFSVYNEGEGIQYHRGGTVAYKSKTEGCKVVRDIPQELLFRGAVWANLGQLFSMTAPEEGEERKIGPDTYLYEHILPLLGGKQGEIQPELIRELSPQRSGTCTYRCLQAWAAYQMRPEEYRKWKYEFRHFLLERFLPQIQESSRHVIRTEGEYRTRTKEHAVIKRSLEKFARAVEKHEEMLTEEESARSQKILLELQASLLKEEKQLLLFEKGVFANDLERLHAAPSRLFEQAQLPPPAFLPAEAPPRFFAPLHSQPIGREAKQIFDRIDRIPPSTERGFSQRIEETLQEMAAAGTRLTDLELLYASQELFRKIGGTTAAWDAVRFLNPSAVFQHLRSLSSLLNGHLAQDMALYGAAASPRAERYLAFLAFHYGMECAFRQLPERERGLTATFPTTLGSPLITQEVGSLCCTDPLWVEFRENIKNIPSIAQDPFHDFRLLQAPGLFRPPMRMGGLTPQLSHWYENLDPHIKENIRLSIVQDRHVQEAEIKRREDELQREIDTRSQELRTLQAEERSLQGQLEVVRQRLQPLESEYTRRYADYQRLYADAQAAIAEWDKKNNAYQEYQRYQSYEWYYQQNPTQRPNPPPTPALPPIGPRPQYPSLPDRSALTQAEAVRRQIQDQIAANQKNQSVQTRAIQTLGQQKNGVRNAVQHEPHYWPQGVESPDKSLLLRFLFTNPRHFLLQKIHVEDLMPQSLRQFAFSSVHCQHIFKKIRDQSGVPFENRLLDLEWNFVGSNAALTSRNNQADLADGLSLLRHDLYQRSLTPDSDEALLYRHMSQREEGGVPRLESGVHTHLMAGDDVRAILQLKTAPDVQIASTLDYFKEHLDKLEKKDWVLLFHSLLFDGHLLMNGLQEREKRRFFIPLLQTFFMDAIQSCQASERIGAAAHLLWLGSVVQQQVDAVFEKEGIVSPLIVAPNQILALMDKGLEGKFASHRAILFESILASAAPLFKKPLDQLTPLDQHIMGYALFARIGSEKIPTTFDTESCFQKCDGKSLTILEIKKFLQAIPVGSPLLLSLMNTHVRTLLDRAFPNLNIGAKVFTQRLGEDVCVIPGELEVSLSSGEIISSNPLAFQGFDEKPLLREHIEFLCGSGLYSEPNELSGIHGYAYQEGGKDCFRFTDHKKNASFLIQTDPGIAQKTLFVQLALSTGRVQWTQFVPEGDRTAYLADQRELKTHYIHLQDERYIYICDPKTYTVRYVAQPHAGSMIINAVGERGEPLPLYLAELPQGDTLFSSFEDASHITCWADPNGMLQKIEFSRYGLRLRKREEVWEVEGQKEWHLAKEQFIPHFRQKTGFLVLENAKGEKKALLPVWEPKEIVVAPPGKKTRALNFPYEYDMKPEACEAHYVECALTGGTVEPKDYESRFYLARIYLEKGYVDEAEELLFSHFSESPHTKLSVQERFLLESIATMPFSGDMGSRTVRLRIRALALLEKNKLQFPDSEESVKRKEHPTEAELEKRKNVLEAAHSLVEEYFTRLGHLAPINPDDELALCRSLRTECQQAGLGTRSLAKRIIELEACGLDALPKERTWTSPPVMDIAGGLLREFDNPESRAFLANPDAIATRALDPGLVQYTMRYSLARVAMGRPLEQRFPFDYRTVAEADWERYFPMIVRECQESSYQAARATGLLPTLYYMAFFHQNERIKKDAQRCLLLINSKGIPASELREEGRVVRVAAASVAPLRLASIAEAVSHLVSLDGVQSNPEEATYLGQLISEERFLSKSRVMREPEKDSALLFSEESVEIGSDPTVRRQFEKLTEDMERADTLTKEVVTYSLEQPLVDLEERLTTNLAHETERLIDIEHAILGSVISALQVNPKSHVRFVAGKRTLPSIEELSILATRKDFHRRMIEKFPEISEDGRRTLQKAIREYLLEKQYVQHMGRALDMVGKIQNEAHEETRQILINDLGKSLETTRAYELDDEHALVFLFMETTLNIKLRQDQIENIERFAEAAAKGDPIALQMIMGAGKTSVLQPILGYLFSLLTSGVREDVLSTVILPEALFGKVKDELFKALGSSFHQFVFVLPYDRSLAKREGYLKSYEMKLKEAHRKGACLLMTPKQKYSILTSLYEAYYDLKGDPRNLLLQERVNSISRICQFLHIHEVDQVDEIDLVKDPNVIFKYPIGERSKVDVARASVLSQILIGLATDGSFNEKVALDFCTSFRKRQDPSYQRRGLHLTQDLFDTVVRPTLVDKAFLSLSKHVKNFGPRMAGNEECLRSFLTQTTPQDEAIGKQLDEKNKMAVMLYLQKLDDEARATLYDDLSYGRPVVLPSSLSREHVLLLLEKERYEEERNRWLERSFTREEREIIGAAAHAICRILPDSLVKECGAHYGVDPQEGQYVARPYDAPNAPKTTKYSDPYQQVVFSTQMALYNGIPLDAAKQLLLRLRKMAREEFEIVGQLDQTEGGRIFTDIMRTAPQDIRRFDIFEEPLLPESIEAFQKMASRHPETLLRFLQESVYGQVNIFHESLSCTPQALTGSSHYACGYTGTMHTSILPQTMQGIPELGTDGKTISAIQRKMAQGTSQILELTETTSFPQQVISHFKSDTSLYVYIDSGGLLKEEKIQRFCTELLQQVSYERPNIKGVVFLNDEDEGRPWIVEQTDVGGIVIQPLTRSQRKTTDGSLITVMPQKYETGTNIPQKPDAKAMMSVRKNMTLRDALQSVFRMRQILSGQNVCFALSPEVKQHLALGIANALLAQEEIQVLFSRADVPSEGDFARILRKYPAAIQGAFRRAFQELLRDPREASEKERLMRFTRLFSGHLPLTSDVLWRYFNVNQARSEQERNWRAAEQRMREVLEKPLRRVLHDTTLSLPDRLSLFTHMQEFFTEVMPDTPYERMKQGQQYLDAVSAVERKIESFLRLYRGLSGPKQVRGEERESLLSEDIVRAVRESIVRAYPPRGEETARDVEAILRNRLEECVNEEDIPSVITVPTHDESEVEVEVEIEVEVEVEVEQEAEVEQELELQVELHHAPLVDKPYQSLVSSLHAFFLPPTFGGARRALTRVLPSYIQSVLGEHVQKFEYSSNLFLDNAELGTSAHGDYHLDARYMLVIEDARTHEKRFVLVSGQDAEMIRKKIKETGRLHEGTVTLLTLNGSCVDRTEGGLPDPSFTSDSEVKKALLLGKLLTGKVSFSKRDVDELERLLLPESDPTSGMKRRSLRRFYESIVRFLPGAARVYRNSFMQRMLAKGTAKEDIHLGGLIIDPSMLRQLDAEETFRAGEIIAVQSEADHQWRYARIITVRLDGRIVYTIGDGVETEAHPFQCQKLRRSIRIVPTMRIGAPVPVSNRRALTPGESFVPGECAAVRRTEGDHYVYTEVVGVRPDGLIRFLDENREEQVLPLSSFLKLKKAVSLTVPRREGAPVPVPAPVLVHGTRVLENQTRPIALGESWLVGETVAVQRRDGNYYAVRIEAMDGWNGALAFQGFLPTDAPILMKVPKFFRKFR